VIGSPASTAPAPVLQAQASVSGSVPAGPARGGGNAPQTGSLVVWLIIAGAYILWAVLHQHEKVRDAIKPGNVAANLHNILLIFLAVLVSMPLAKITLAKLGAWVPALKPVTAPALQVVEAS
jgi:hypothetical protein